MSKILKGLMHIFKDTRVVIALLPAMIGLMPSWEGIGFCAHGGGGF
jgi:hypothetical protein